MKKFAITIALILTLPVLTFTQNSCRVGCGKCSIDSFKTCKGCFITKLIDGKCTPQSPDSNFCMIDSESGCELCIRGYSPNREGKCQKVKIENCAIEYYRGSETFCPICWDGLVPNEELTACLDTGKDENKKCLLGGRPLELNGVCGICRKGFYSKNERCVDVGELEIPGCLQVNLYYGKIRCNWCNVFEGWYDPDGEGKLCLKANNLNEFLLD